MKKIWLKRLTKNRRKINKKIESMNKKRRKMQRSKINKIETRI
jgi:hypothetical protein